MDDEIAGSCFFGLSLRATPGGDKEDRLGFTPEMMAKDVERTDGIAKCPSHFFARAALDEVGAKSFVLALFGMLGLEEETAD